jgi:hypothetical protein
MRPAYRVYYEEFERGWGSRLDGHRDFEGDDAEEKAKAHVVEFNSKNDAKVVPDWYMIAHAPQMVDLDTIKK